MGRAISELYGGSRCIGGYLHSGQRHAGPHQGGAIRLEDARLVASDGLHGGTQDARVVQSCCQTCGCGLATQYIDGERKDMLTH